MKKILLFLLLLTPLRALSQATVYGSLVDAFGQPVESWVIFKPEWGPLAFEPDTLVTLTKKVHTTNGVFIATNVLAGQYTVSLPSIERDICIMVPTNASFYSFNYLAGLCTNVPAVVSFVPNGVLPFSATILADDVPEGSGNTPVILAELDNGAPFTVIKYEP